MNTCLVIATLAILGFLCFSGSAPENQMRRIVPLSRLRSRS